MAPSLVDRIARMVEDGVAGFLEGMEGDTRPHPLQQAISDLRDALGSLVAERHLARKQEAALVAELDALRERAERAVDAGRDDLARAVLQRLHDLEKDRDRLRATISRMDAECLRLSRLVDDLRREAGDRGAAVTESAALAELDQLAAKARTLKER